MAKPKECQACQKTATIHLTQIVDGKISKIDLCEDCVHKEKYVGDLAFGKVEQLAEGLKKVVVGQLGQNALPPCPACGIRVDQIGKSGRVGCSTCYDHFGDVLSNWVEKVQGALGHAGKVPAHSGRKAEGPQLKSAWQRDLAEAVAEERYEDAAVLRDRLRKLEEPGK